MDFGLLGFDTLFLHTIHNMLDSDESESNNKSISAPTRTYVRDAKAMAATPVDIKEYPGSYVFVMDMPDLKSRDIKVQVEDDNVLIISGERKREEEKEGSKYVRMERRVGKFMRKFVLQDNADTQNIATVCKDGVLTVPPNFYSTPVHNNNVVKKDESSFSIIIESLQDVALGDELSTIRKRVDRLRVDKDKT